MHSNIHKNTQVYKEIHLHIEMDICTYPIIDKLMCIMYIYIHGLTVNGHIHLFKFSLIIIAIESCSLPQYRPKNSR